MALPAMVVLGCVVKASVAGAAAVILNAALVTAVQRADGGGEGIARRRFRQLQIAEGGHAVHGIAR